MALNDYDPPARPTGTSDQATEPTDTDAVKGPGAGAVPAAGTPPAEAGTRTGGSAANQWSSFLSDPKTRSALMQFGVNMLQPIAPGQNLIGQIGEAIGAGGEAADRYQASQNALLQKQQELQTAQSTAASEAALREAQGTYYRETGSARQLIAQVRQMDPKQRNLSALSSLYSRLAEENSRIEPTFGASDPTVVSNTALMNELKPLIDAATQEELTRIRSGTPGAGAAGAAPGAAAGVVDPAAVTQMKGMSESDATAAATRSISAHPGDPVFAANVRASLLAAFPGADVSSLPK